MIGKPKNKFMDRFRTIIRSTAEQSQQRSEHQLSSYRSVQIDSFHASKAQVKNIVDGGIIQKLQNHINYLQKKLKDYQQSIRKNDIYINSLLKRIAEREENEQESIRLIQSLHENIREITSQIQMIKSDYQNLILKNKMQKLTLQVNEGRAEWARVQLKHQQHRQGKFSSAFLPAQFGSPNRYLERSPKQFETIILEYQLKNRHQSSFIPQNGLNNYLTCEWRAKKEENERLIKEINLLKSRNHQLQQQIQTSNRLCKIKQFCPLTNDLPSINAQLQKQLDEMMEENKLLMQKLRQNQERMIQISMALKQHSQQSKHDILQSQFTNEKVKAHAITSQVIKYTILLNQKMQKSIQTDTTVNPEKNYPHQYHEYKLKLNPDRGLDVEKDGKIQDI